MLATRWIDIDRQTPNFNMAAETTRQQSAEAEKGQLDYTQFDQAGLDDKVLNEEAREATAAEHNLTFVQAMKTYKRAAFWSIRKCSREGLWSL